MCDRIGCTHFPKLSEMDFSGVAAQPSRRRFLKGAAAVSTISMGMLAGTAHAGAPVKSSSSTASLTDIGFSAVVDSAMITGLKAVTSSSFSSPGASMT